MADTMRRVPKSMHTMIFDPFAKRRTDCPHEVEERNYKNAFVVYCSECMEKYGLQAGKLANRRVGTCGICGNEGFLVGNMSADSETIKSVNYFLKFKKSVEEILEKYIKDIDLNPYLNEEAKEQSKKTLNDDFKKMVESMRVGCTSR